MPGIVLVPLTLHLLPIYSLAIDYSLGLTQSLLALLLLGIAQLHRLYSDIVQDMDHSAMHTILQVFRTESLPLYIKV